jgi:hypothetical protein
MEAGAVTPPDTTCVRRLVPASAEAVELVFEAVGDQLLKSDRASRRGALAFARATCAHVRVYWELEPLRAATGVELTLELQRPTWPLRIFLRLGGRRTLARGVAQALAIVGCLARLAQANAEHPLP